MSIAGITADHLEFSANRTLAYAILATEAPNDYLRLYRMNKVLSELRKMLPLLTAEFSQSFPEQQKDRLILRLQDAYKILAEVSGSGETERIVRHLPMSRTMVVRCQERAEDLADVFEETMLTGSDDFNALVSYCMDSVVAERERHTSGMKVAQDRSREFMALWRRRQITYPSLNADVTHAFMANLEKRAGEERTSNVIVEAWQSVPI